MQPAPRPPTSAPLVLDGVISGVDPGNRKVYTSGVCLMGEPSSDPARLTAYRALIVPHCSCCGETLRLLLSLSGYHAEVVRRGDAAIGRALEVLPQAVLVALNLADDDGWDVGRRLQAGLGGAVRLIGLAPNAWEGDEAAWAEAGFDSWLRQPVSPDELLGLLPRARAAEPLNDL